MTRFHQITECSSSKPHLICGVNGGNQHDSDVEKSVVDFSRPPCAQPDRLPNWRQVIYRDGELVGLDYSVGALLNREGRPIPPPRAFLDAFVSRSPAGEPVNE